MASGPLTLPALGTAVSFNVPAGAAGAQGGDSTPSNLPNVYDAEVGSRDVEKYITR